MPELANSILTWRIDAVVFGFACVLSALIARRLIGNAPTPTRVTSTYRLVLLLLPMLAIGGAEFSHHRERQRLQAMVEGFAPTYAHELRTQGILQLNDNTQPDDPTYLKLIDAQKAWLSVNPAVADIYTFYRRPDGTTILLVDSETDYNGDGAYVGEREARTPIGEAYDEMTPEIDAAFAGIANFDPSPTTDRWGTWVSALVPIFDAGGKVHSVLGVDYPAHDWVASILVSRASMLLVGFLLQLLVVAGHSLFATSLARARAAAQADARQQFLAHMSHEIRTPMTAILGHADLLADDSANLDERARCIMTIQRSGQHLLSILDDILDFAKLEAGARQPRRQPVILRELVAEVVAMHSRNARAKDLDLRHDVADEVPPVVQSDPRMLRQILLNLVGNAVKFTMMGRVDLAVRVVDTQQGLRLRLSVRDTGPGMSEAERHGLFQPFVQGSASLDRRHGGTGLGLSISRRLANALDGDIELTTEPGHGCEFTVDLPCITAEAPAAEPKPSNATRAMASSLRGRILVVDDGQDNRTLLGAFLRKAGLEVECIADGRQCLDRLAKQETQPDLILMDVQMPGLDGHETTRRLRASGIRVPIVAVTAHALPEDRAQCIDAGCDDYLSKPIDRQLLLATVERLLPTTPPNG